VTGTFALYWARVRKVTAALSEPVAFGVNVTEIVHVAPPAIDEPSCWLERNSRGSCR